MNPVVLVVIGLGAIYLLKGSSTPAALTPLQAAQLAAAQQAARVQQQQSNSLGSLLASLLGPNKQQQNLQAAPKSSGGGGGGLSNSSGGSGVSKPAGSALGAPAAGCLMAACDKPTGGGSTSLGSGVCEHPDGTVTVNGQLYCESTGQLIADGPCLPPCLAGPAIANCSCDVGQQNFNICGGLNTPPGGVATFCPVCFGGFCAGGFC